MKFEKEWRKSEENLGFELDVQEVFEEFNETDQ